MRVGETLPPIAEEIVGKYFHVPPPPRGSDGHQAALGMACIFGRGCCGVARTTAFPSGTVIRHRGDPIQGLPGTRSREAFHTKLTRLGKGLRWLFCVA